MSIVETRSAANAVVQELVALRGAVESLQRRLSVIERARPSVHHRHVRNVNQTVKVTQRVSSVREIVTREAPPIRVVEKDTDPITVDVVIEPGGQGGRRNVGRAAYELRRAGATWRAIGDYLGYGGHRTPDSSACAAAKYYADKHGLPWPLELS